MSSHQHCNNHISFRAKELRLSLINLISSIIIGGTSSGLLTLLHQYVFEGSNLALPYQIAFGEQKAHTTDKKPCASGDDISRQKSRIIENYKLSHCNVDAANKSVNATRSDFQMSASAPESHFRVDHQKRDQFWMPIYFRGSQSMDLEVTLSCKIHILSCVGSSITVKKCKGWMKKSKDQMIKKIRSLNQEVRN